MPRLKEINLFGFKSFAKKTKLRFIDGISAIVGPNGCGKSNICDAFSWVLGTQSTKSLRLDAMQDVIFSGSSTRPALQLAEVCVTFCNEDDFFKAPYKEIAILRKLYRDGSSEYRINQKQVRLKDIYEILGIGKQFFSIIGQGKIDEMITQAPKDRRIAFEEVAGVLRFLQKRDEALKKLALTKDNLIRIEDIVREVTKQKEQLEEQAKKAKEQRDLEELLRVQERTYFASKALFFQEKKQRYRTQQNVLFLEEKAFLDEEKKLEGLIKEKKSALYELFREQGLLKEKLLMKRTSEKYEKKALNELQEDQRKKAFERQTIEKQLHIVEEKRKTVLNEQKEYERKQTEKTQSLEESLKEKAQVEAEYQSQEKIIVTSLEAQQKASQELFQEQKKIQDIEQRLLRKTIEAKNSKEQFSQLVVKEAKYTEERAFLMQEKEALEKKKTEQEAEKGVLEARLQEIIEENLKRQEQLEEVQERFQRVEKAIIGVEAKEQTMRSLEKEAMATSGMRLLLQEAKNKESIFFDQVVPLSTLLPSLEVDSRWLSYIGTLYGETVVVPTKRVLEEVLLFCTKKKCVNIGFFCLEHFIEKVSSSWKEDPSLVEMLYAHFGKTPLLSDLKELSVQNVPAWIEHFGYIDASCVLVLFKESTIANNPFLRKKELDEILQKKKSLVEEKERLQIELLDSKSIVQHLQNEKTAITEQIRGVQTAFERITMQYEHLLKNKERLEKEERELFEKKAFFEKEHLKASEEEKMLTEEKEGKKKVFLEYEMHGKQLEKEAKQAKELLTALQKKKLESTTQYEQERKRLYEIEQLFLQKQKEEVLLENQYTQFVLRKEELIGKEKEQSSIEERLKDTIEELLQEIKQLEQEDVILVKKIQDEKKDHLDVRLGELQKKKLTQASTIASNRKEIEHIEALLEDLQKEIIDLFAVSLDALKEYASTKSLSEQESRVKKLKRSLEMLGPVNMHAIEEYETVSERYGFLMQQLGDLTQAEKELSSVIDDLEKMSHKIFLEAFSTIRASFQRNFGTLFQGGEADIVLTNEKNILEAGIEIIARPPGKKMRSLHLLSGGEKCLTAFSLLLAFLEYRACPFCILDEVDAPLDEANVDRFILLIEEFSKKCQFLVVTHNKRTMSKAGTLIGVSMQEQGVSELMTMVFEDTVPQLELITR